MKIRISKPIYHLENFDFHGDVKQFYDILPEIIAEMGLECDMTIATIGRTGKQIIREKNTLCLAWHLHGNLPDIWHLKTAYLPDYFYFDKYGYSGWSDLAQEYNYDIDIEDIRDEMQEFCDNYIASNRTRALQPESAYIPEEPYVLVLTQRPGDSVIKEFAYMDSQKLLDEVTELYKDTDYTVCVKTHPFSDPENFHSDEYVRMSPDTFHATGSMHKIIAGATAVYTVNSGSGFEALMHGKRVFTSGKSDYHWVTTTVKNKQDLQDTMHLIEEPVDKDEILKFLHYVLNEYFVNIHDKQTIKDRIELAISQYSSSL
jgi:capsule polysaccharide export protein KpsC/LpsZ